MSLVDDFLAKERELFSDPLLGSLAGATDSGTAILVTESEPPVLESTQNGSDESTADSPPSSKTASPEPKSSPVSTMLEEWKIERAASLQKKDDEESRKVAELRKLAAEQLRNWYAVQDTLVESNKVLNRANELKSLKSEKKNTTTSPDWTAISTVSSTPAVGHGIDTSRMKTAILKMVSADAKGQMAAVTRTAPRKMGLVVAMDLDGGIAKGGKIPWSLRKDMAFFKQITSTTSDKSKRNAVIMGRKCWESIPEKFRPLKGRLNVVVSRTLPEQKSQDLIVSNNFDETLQELSQSEEIESIWNIGGTEIYQLALKKDLIDRLIVTKIDKRYDTDLFLKVDWNSFTENPDSTVNVEEDGTKFSIHFYAPS